LGKVRRRREEINNSLLCFALLVNEKIWFYLVNNDYNVHAHVYLSKQEKQIATKEKQQQQQQQQANKDQS